jgi:hypothetical protein
VTPITAPSWADVIAAEPQITPGTDTVLRVFVETVTGFHLLGKFDSHHDAKRAKQAAESVPAMLAAIFSPIPADNHANDTAAALRQRFQGE